MYLGSGGLRRLVREGVRLMFENVSFFGVVSFGGVGSSSFASNGFSFVPSILWIFYINLLVLFIKMNQIISESLA